MPAASNAQVQHFVDERIRPFCEAARSLKLQADSIKSLIDDVYAALTQPTPTWTDTRTDGPPHLLTPGDVININGWLSALITALDVTAGTLKDQYGIVLKGCVRGVSG